MPGALDIEKAASAFEALPIPGAPFGFEVKIDLSETLDPSEKQALRQLYQRDGLILVRDQKLSMDHANRSMQHIWSRAQELAGKLHRPRTRLHPPYPADRPHSHGQSSGTTWRCNTRAKRSRMVNEHCSELPSRNTATGISTRWTSPPMKRCMRPRIRWPPWLTDRER
jgi:hypothetical protein